MCIRNKISVITINYNNFSGLEKTLNSIKNQNKKYFEYIIIDGNSSDGSIDLIKKNKSIIDFSVIENDDGIFDAMNKGVEISTGKYLFFLNSGEIFIENDALQKISMITEKVNTNLIIGKSLFTYDDINYFSQNFWPYFNHQSVLIKGSIHKDNLYDTNLKLLGDLELWLRLKSKNLLKYKKTNLKFVKMKLDGVGSSNSKKSIKLKIRDKKYILSKYPYSFYQYLSLIKLYIKLLF